jgi:hypothetical protein
MNAVIIGLSTGVADVARRGLDSGGEATAGGFFLYVFVVMVTAFLLHTLFYIVLGWGGGMLANKGEIEEASWSFFWTGSNTPADDSDATSTNSARLM